MSENIKAYEKILNKKYPNGYLKIEEVMRECNLGKWQVRMYLHKWRCGRDMFRICGVAEFLARKEEAA